MAGYRALHRSNCSRCSRHGRTCLLARCVSIAAAIVAAVHSAGTHAARPFVTDDARIVDTGGCQIESFVKRQRRHQENEIWFLPGCAPVGQVELTLGGFRTDNADAGTSSTAIAQAKTLLRTLRTNDFGLALTLGAARLNSIDPVQQAGWSPFLNVVGSLSVLDDRAVLHANVGSLRDRGLSRTRHTWGLGAEILLSPRFSGIVETYGQEAERPSRQVGLRFWVVPNRFQIDGTLGAQSGQPHSRAWTSIGFRALF